MDTPFLSSLAGAYHWQLSLYTAIGIAAVTVLGKRLLLLVPTVREAQRANREAFAVKMQKPIPGMSQDALRRARCSEFPICSQHMPERPFPRS